MAKRKKSKKSSASKKKQSSKKDKTSKEESGGLPDSFWRQVMIFVLVLLALLLAAGNVSIGGSLPVGLSDVTMKLVGNVAYIVPAILVYAAFKKARTETTKIPRSTFWGLTVFTIAASGVTHLFTDTENSLDAADAGNGGGLVGHYLDSFLLAFLDKFFIGFLLVIVAIISLHFVLQIPLTAWLKLLGLAERKKSEEKEESTKKKDDSKDEDAGFKLNEGVPVQRARGLATLKNTAKKLSDDEMHDALTASSDPEWKLPGLDLLEEKQDKADAGDVEGNAGIIKDTMADFNIDVEMSGANIGPRVTQYTLKPPSGVRLTKITALENNLALNLAATSIRIEAPIPGQRAVGIEVPNLKAATVRMHSVIDSREWKGSKSSLSFSIGRDIAGTSMVGQLDKMPHLLVAGATGSGKSVMINALLSSLLYRNSPSDLKLILVDPKQVELTPYNDLPHLLTPVIVEPEKCISALKWAVAEMERRYTALSEAGKRNIADYNKVKKEEGMPYIVIVIDELADLMMLAARDVEALIVRLAQKARAVGIHLVLATQRPSVDVITGLIKANIPARIAFTVTSQVDSRTIIDQAGAEKLLGSGDMLLLTPELAKPKRIQGVFIDDKEVNAVTDFIRMQRAPEYDDSIITQPVQLGGKGAVIGGGDDPDDSLYEDAVNVVIESGKASASLLQRRLRVGYARAARLIETMEEQGIVGPADGARPREVLVNSMSDVFGGDDDDQAGS